MDGVLIVGILLFAVMVGSVLVVTFAEQRAKVLLARDARNRHAIDELQRVDAIIEGVGRLGIPDDLRALLRRQRQQLAHLLDARTAPEAPPAIDTRTPVRALGSQRALTQALAEMQSARRYLRDLERSGGLANTERTRLVQELTRLSVQLQAESLEVWSAAPGVDANTADGYLRDAQELLAKSVHLDGSFNQRIAALKERQQALANERVRKARDEAEARHAEDQALKARTADAR